MPAAPSIGTVSQFGVGTTSTISTMLEYLNFGVGKRGTVLDTAGVRGTRAHPVERTRIGTYVISGPISLNVGPADLLTLLPFITGTGASPFTPAESPTEFWVGIDRIVKVMTYNNCKVDKATFRARVGSLLEVSLDVEGLTETPTNAGTFPVLSPTTAAPYVMMDCVLQVGGTGYQFHEYEFGIDWHLKKDRFVNGLSRSDLPSLDRTTSVGLSLPYTSDTIALYDAVSTSGVAVIATFTNGAKNLIISTPAVQFPTDGIVTPGREEITLPLRGQARKTGSTAEFSITEN